MSISSPRRREKLSRPNALKLSGRILETGVVRAIHVRDGQQVKTGEVVIEIDPTINGAERDRLEQELYREIGYGASPRHNHLCKEDLNAAFVAPEGATAEQITMQRENAC